MKVSPILPIVPVLLLMLGFSAQNSTASPLAASENELQARVVRLEANFFKVPDSSGYQDSYYGVTQEASTLLTDSGNLNDISTPNAVQKTCVTLLTDYDKAAERLFKDIDVKNVNYNKIDKVDNDELAVYEADLQNLFNTW